ncbi:histidine phosphatase family protein [Nocardioides sp. CER19]|uniref:SixA phosphatase family protein n=1 Tax=Nocardioides sp. CER19 TaxID=3038538 RepID=UPI002446DECC|nr:histidine phosphatase family protein [Nocardioides sp. CER19]MDH2415752.1 histidine phosphatase family protein [Nocardioides sp. CER19]
MTRVLVIVRHAKAEAYGATDHERPLTERGITAAAQAGTWLAGRGVTPDRAVVSDAVRTRQTWEAMAAEAGWTLEPELDSSLYEADAETALDVIRGLEDDVTTTVVVGHNPTMAYLAQVLDVEGASQLAATGFPTAAVAVFEYDGPWADLAEASTRLVDVHVEHG